MGVGSDLLRLRKVHRAWSSPTVFVPRRLVNNVRVHCEITVTQMLGQGYGKLLTCLGRECHSSICTSAGVWTVVYMPQYCSLVFFPSTDGSTRTWNLLIKAAPGNERINPGFPIPVGANGCLIVLAQRKHPAVLYPGTFAHTGRSKYVVPPKILLKVDQDMSGVCLAQAASRTDGLRSLTPAARKIAERLRGSFSADNLAMIPTRNSSESDSM